MSRVKTKDRDTGVINDLQVSGARLQQSVGAYKERDRIIQALVREEKETNNSFITFDRAKLIINQGEPT